MSASCRSTPRADPVIHLDTDSPERPVGIGSDPGSDEGGAEEKGPARGVGITPVPRQGKPRYYLVLGGLLTTTSSVSSTSSPA